MELTFRGDATELMFLVKRLQETHEDESLANAIVDKLPNALLDALYKRDGN